MRHRQLRASLLHEFSVDDADRVVFGASMDGSIIVATCRTSEALSVDRGIGRFPKSKLDAPVDYTITRWNSGKQMRTTHKGEHVVASYVQPLGEGTLLVGARCYWRESGAEQNALVVDPAGAVVRRFTLGDGIADVRTANGAIWVSYFDEGVFGNYGWARPGPDPIGASGLVRFDSAGAPTLTFDSAAARTSIVDVYALNVVGDDDVWLYPYTGFPVVNIARGAYRTWDYGEGGARALCVREDRVLLFGGYSEPNVGKLLRLDRRGSAKTEAVVAIVDDDGKDVGDSRMFGVGAELYLLSGRRALAVTDW